MNWIGNKFDKDNPNRFNRKWICQQIRKDLKEALGKDWKITVKKDSWNSIEVTIRKCPIEFLTEEAKNMNIRVLELEVISDNHRGINLYHKMGFEDIGIYKDYFYVNDTYKDAIVMQKIL